jgi:RimJ/RimL family protein N-acetyltransferase
MNLPKLDDNGTPRLFIRVMERKDLEDLRQMHNRDDVLLKLTDPTHITQVQQEAWFNAASSSRNARRYVAHLRGTNEFVGMFRVDSIDFVNGNAFVGCDILPAHQRQGYATEFFIYILNYLFDACRLHRVELVTLESNTRAIRLYKKFGFVEEGARREAVFRDGAYQNLLAMGLLADDWHSKRKNLSHR